jgi:hypothetical protein
MDVERSGLLFTWRVVKEGERQTGAGKGSGDHTYAMWQLFL